MRTSTLQASTINISKYFGGTLKMHIYIYMVPACQFNTKPTWYRNWACSIVFEYSLHKTRITNSECVDAVMQILLQMKPKRGFYPAKLWLYPTILECSFIQRHIPISVLSLRITCLSYKQWVYRCCYQNTNKANYANQN